MFSDVEEQCDANVVDEDKSISEREDGVPKRENVDEMKLAHEKTFQPTAVINKTKK